MKPLHILLALGFAWLPGCGHGVSERVIHEQGGDWSIRQVTQQHASLGPRTHYRLYYRGELVRFAPPLVRRETVELLSVGHFNPGVSPYPDLIVLVHDRFTNERGFGDAQVRAFQLIARAGRVDIVPIAIP